MSPFGAKARCSGTKFHHGVAILVADPDVVLCADGHAVRLVLVADHVLADGADKLVILVELKQLRFSLWVALKGEKVLFGVWGDCRAAACSSVRQIKRMRRWASECMLRLRECERRGEPP